MSDSDMQRSNGEPEAVRRRDGGGETSPLPGSEAARGNEARRDDTTAPDPTVEIWTPGKDETGIRPGSPAAATMAGTAPADAPAKPDDDDQSGRIPQPAATKTGPKTGADAPDHGSR